MVVSVEGSLPTNVMAGMLAGVISSSVANPTDVLKVHYVVVVISSWCRCCDVV